jgi:FkbM family methyltransferase
MIISLAKLIHFVWSHPLNRGGRMKAIFRVLRWQVASQVLPEASVLLPLFRGGAGLLVRRGMTGATGNWYCGLDEMEDMSLVLHALRPGDLFVDVGANVGSYSIIAAAGAKATVIAVEPIQETFSHLFANIRINDLSGSISAHCVGLSNKQGTLAFTTALDSVNHVLLDGEDEDSRAVAVTTMDALCAHQQPVVIKIDVEGHELAVLKGAESTLESPALLAVIIELNGSGSRYGINDAEVDAFMIHRGFRRCRYLPLERQLTFLDESPKNGGNTLYAKNIELLKQRVQSASRVALSSHII